MNLERGIQATLTGQVGSSTLDKGAYLFMADVGNSEVNIGKPLEARSPLSISSKDVRSPELARRLGWLEGRIESMPISEWSRNELVQQSANWRKFQAENATSAEITEAANLISEDLTLEAIRRKQDPVKFAEDVLKMSGQNIPENLSLIVQTGLLELSAKGRLSDLEVNEALRASGRDTVSEVEEGISAHVSQSEFEHALAKGPDAVRELMAKKGVKEDPASKSGAEILAYQFSAGTPDFAKWNAFITGTSGMDHEVFKQTNRLLVKLNTDGLLSKKVIREELDRVIRLANVGDELVDPDRVDPHDLIEYRRLLEEVLFSKSLPEEIGGDRVRQQQIERYNALTVNGLEIKRILKNTVGAGISDRDAKEIIKKIREDMEFDEERFEDSDIEDVLGPAGTIEAQLTAAANDNVRRTIIKDMFENRLAMKQADVLNPTAGFYEEQINVVSGIDKATRKLIVKIISVPMEDKTQTYRLGFYPGNNLEAVKQALIDRVSYAEKNSTYTEAQEVKAFFKDMSNLIEGVQHAHNLHTILMKSDLRQFGDYSGQLTGSHLNAIFGEKGVAILNRLIEEQFDYSLAVDSGITNLTNRVRDPHSSDELVEPGSYDRMFGYRTEDGSWEDGTISELYEGLVSMGNALGLGEEYQLEDYQRKFAKDMARYVYALTLRAPEKISLTEFPQDRGAFKELVARLPMNRVSSMFNLTTLTAERWGLGDTRGGQKMLQLVRRNYNSSREVQGWNTPLLSRVRGVSVENMEIAKLSGSQGFDRSWRQYLVYYRNSPFINPDTNGRGSVGDYIKDTTREIRSMAKDHHNPAGAVDILHNAFLDDHGELRPMFNHSLGLLLMESVLTPKEVNKLNMGKAYTDKVLQIRAAVYRRAAQDNPLAIATMVNKAEVFGDIRDLEGKDLALVQHAWSEATKGKSVAEIQAMSQRRDDLIALLEPTKGAHAVDLKGRDKEAWSGRVADGKRQGGLELKLTMAQEIRQQKIREVFESATRPWPPIPTVDQILASHEELHLNASEQDLLNRVRNIGSEMAPELGTIRFPSTPFMNDVLYENANFAGAGEEAFKDTFSEIATYSTVQEKFINIVVNPGDKKQEDVYASFAEMVNQLGDPLGADDAQDLLYSFVVAYQDMIWKGGLAKEMGKGLWSQFWEQDNVVSWMRTKQKLPSSIIQYYVGNKGPALDVDEMYDFAKHLLETGVLRKNMFDTDTIHDDLGYTSTTEREIGRIKGALRKVPILGKRIKDHPHWYIHSDLWKKNKKRFWQEGKKGFLLRTGHTLANVTKIGIMALIFDLLSEGTKGAGS